MQPGPAASPLRSSGESPCPTDHGLVAQNCSPTAKVCIAVQQQRIGVDVRTASLFMGRWTVHVDELPLRGSAASLAVPGGSISCSAGSNKTIERDHCQQGLCRDGTPQMREVMQLTS